MDMVRSTLLSQFPELVHGFSTKEWGNMSYRRDADGKAYDNNRAFLEALGVDKRTPILDPCLNHGDTVVLVKEIQPAYRLFTISDPGVLSYSLRQPLMDPDRTICVPYEGVDACWTERPGVCLTMRPADCAILMLYDPETHIVGMVHAGTVGVLSNIVKHSIQFIEGVRGVRPHNLFCYVGPSISAESYDLRHTGMWAKGLKDKITEQQARDYDPKAIIRGQLLECGLRKSNIQISEECTAKNPNRYFSNRLAKSDEQRRTLGRMLAVIGMRV